MSFETGARQVIATRPDAQNKNWAAALTEHGFKVDCVTLLNIEFIDSAADATLRTCISRLDEFTKLIFVSQNAVHAMLNLIDRWWPQLPINQNYFAIGSKTHQQLQLGLNKLGQEPAIVSPVAMNSESLLERPELEQVENEKILICRGRGGRPLLTEVLEQRGALVEYCELYYRQVPVNLSEKIAATGVNSATIVPVFSGESLSNFAHNTPIRNCKLVVPSQRVAEQAQDLGFVEVYTAKNASSTAMLNTLLQLK